MILSTGLSVSPVMPSTSATWPSVSAMVLMPSAVLTIMRLATVAASSPPGPAPLGPSPPSPAPGNGATPSLLPWLACFCPGGGFALRPALPQGLPAGLVLVLVVIQPRQAQPGSGLVDMGLDDAGRMTCVFAVPVKRLWRCPDALRLGSGMSRPGNA